MNEMTPEQLQWVLDHNEQIRGSHRVKIQNAVLAWRADRERADAAPRPGPSAGENWPTSGDVIQAAYEMEKDLREHCPKLPIASYVLRGVMERHLSKAMRRFLPADPPVATSPESGPPAVESACAACEVRDAIVFGQQTSCAAGRSGDDAMSTTGTAHTEHCFCRHNTGGQCICCHCGVADAAPRPGPSAGESVVQQIRAAAQEYLDYLQSFKPLGAAEFTILKGRIVTLACNLLADPPVAAPPETPCWLPIESAPKDETDVLLGVWYSSDRWLTGIGRWNKSRFEENKVGWGWTWYATPTHWMPLPGPPAASPRPRPEEPTR